MHTSHLHDRLIRMRGSRTGESRQALHRWARALEPTLAPADRVALVEAVRRPVQVLDGNPIASPLSGALRRRVFPAALGHAQCELETGVLTALVRGFQHLTYHPHARGFHLGHAITSVRPEPDSAYLTLDPHILGPMLAELLPIEDDEESLEVSGTVGARVRWHKTGQLEMFLIDSVPRAKVVVTGVQAAEWRAARAYVWAARSAALKLGERYPDTSSPSEVERLRFGPRFYLPVHLGSGLLRRVGIFRDVWSISFSGAGIESLNLEWRGGPSTEAALVALCHPVAQITQGRFTAQEWHGLHLGEINDLDPPKRPAGSRVARGAELMLRRLPENRPRPVDSEPGAMADAWRAWEAAYAASPPRHAGRRRRSSARRQVTRNVSSERLDELVTLRCTYTGETRSSAEGCIASLANETDLGMLSAGLIPEAHSLDQRVLETSLLLAIRYASERAHSSRFHQVFRAVSPRKNSVVVELDEAVVKGFLSAVLAGEDPSPSGDGVPGLRLVPGQNGIGLRLLGANGVLSDAKVEIKNVTMRDWDGIWSEINRTVEREYRRVDPRLDRSPRLSLGERAGLAYQRRVCGPVGLGSAMLRRIGLLTGTEALDVWPGLDKTQIHVEIHGGPSISSVVHALRHPIAGFPGDSVVYAEIDTMFAQVQDNEVTAERFTGDLLDMDSPPALIFRRLDRDIARRRTS